MVWACFQRSRLAFVPVGERGDHLVAGWRSVLLLIALLFAAPQAGMAAGMQSTLRGDDLQVDIDSRWPGLGHGGYYPIRIKAINRGEGRTFTFLFRPQSGMPAPSVTRTVAISQNATVEFSLLIPAVGQEAFGMFEVYHGGRRVSNMSQSLSLPDVNHGDSRPSLLVVTTQGVSVNAFEQAVERLNTSAASGGGYSPYGYYSSRTEDHEILPPQQLPSNWIAYTGLDLLAISVADLEALETETLQAIMSWVETGGNLIVHSVQEHPRQRQGVASLLGLSQYAGSQEWTNGGMQHRRVLPSIETDQYGNPLHSGAAAVEQAETETSSEPAADFEWPARDDTFVYRDVMLGRVCLFDADPFPGQPSDWGWFLQSVGPERYRWVDRHGFSSRMQHDEFLQFLVPNVRAVPVYSFLVLITIFTIIIGPLNYYWLLKRKQLHMLLLTVPVLALATSVTLVSYSLVAHGFSIKSRTRSITLIDQPARKAVSVARVAYYAGMAPGGGMTFTPDTAVFPIWPDETTFESGRVDWTDQQRLQSGWLRSRTRTQFVIVQNRDERGRIDLQLDDPANATAANGLEWDLEWLLVRGEGDEFYVARNVDAGSNVQLAVATDDDLAAISNRLKENAPAYPEGVSGPISEMFNFSPSRAYYYGGSNSLSATFSRNNAERLLSQHSRPGSAGSSFGPRTYLAVCKERPGLQIGVNARTSSSDFDVIIGRF